MQFLILRQSIITVIAGSLMTILMAGCASIEPAPQAESTAQSSESRSDLNQPESAIIDNFVVQMDGEFGYRMLRPANWVAIHLGTTRGYRSAEVTSEPNRLLLTISNLEVLATISPEGPLVRPWLEFQESDSFEAWMEQREAAWTQMGQTMNLSFKRHSTLPNGAIYVLVLPDQEQVQLIGYVVDDDRPLAVSLEGFGTYGQLDTLEGEGLLDDFATMLQSAEAIEPDPETVDPPLPSQ